MNAIQLEQQAGFHPNDIVRGRVSGGSVTGEVRLYWITTGRGTEEVGIVDRAAPGADGSFALKHPGAPYTVSGSLVSISWGVEWVNAEGDALAHQDITISPTGARIELDTIKKPKSGKASFGWMKRK